MQTSSNDSVPMSEINVTPLVDVMLVLLIIFMITAPKLEQGVHVDLPQVVTEPLPVQSEELVLSVTREQKIYINKYEIGLGDLESRLLHILEERPDRDVFLRADKDLPYGFVVEVMAEVRKAGVSMMGMVTEPERIRR